VVVRRYQTKTQRATLMFFFVAFLWVKQKSKTKTHALGLNRLDLKFDLLVFLNQPFVKRGD